MRKNQTTEKPSNFFSNSEKPSGFAVLFCGLLQGTGFGKASGEAEIMDLLKLHLKLKTNKQKKNKTIFIYTSPSRDEISSVTLGGSTKGLHSQDKVGSLHLHV